ncbi:hypothetical protein CAPTEDRAFT_202517 [Capitella teleta]|uniref:Uncharacterized protein n=1 Tax=Capitella teleta TaxID=283909 RepID=R7UBU3_CAPTE|nr:hypothetical protein CAPTEDRAFT_202517 [Capitella teleta]|eukprot:ELU01273.1 hypothetical protein CAPTEDRAFT_202517 [Capitella teleta]
MAIVAYTSNNNNTNNNITMHPKMPPHFSDVPWCKPRLPPIKRKRDSLPRDASQTSASSSSMALFRVISLVPSSTEPRSGATQVSLRFLRSHEKYEIFPAPELLPNPRSPLTPASPELQPKVPHPPATSPPAQSRRRHRVAACRDCQEAKEEKVALREENRHLLDTLAKCREEVLQLKAQILALQSPFDFKGSLSL